MPMWLFWFSFGAPIYGIFLTLAIITYGEAGLAAPDYAKKVSKFASIV
jgi:hypothetical protein